MANYCTVHQQYKHHIQVVDIYKFQVCTVTFTKEQTDGVIWWAIMPCSLKIQLSVSNLCSGHVQILTSMLVRRKDKRTDGAITIIMSTYRGIKGRKCYSIILNVLNNDYDVYLIWSKQRVKVKKTFLFTYLLKYLYVYVVNTSQEQSLRSDTRAR